MKMPCSLLHYLWGAITDRGFFHTVMGLLLGLALPPIVAWCRRPKLKCVIYDKYAPANAAGLAFASIGVVNLGKTTAKAVNVRLFNLEPISDNHPIKHLVQEYIPFRWAIDHGLTDFPPSLGPLSAKFSIV